MDKHAELTRRERQIMDIVYAQREATATDVLEALDERLSRVTVRTMLRILEEKGHLKHTKRGRQFVYRPVRPRRRAGQSAMRRLLDTFFDGSLVEAVSAHMVDRAAGLEDDELRRLADLVRQAREKRRDSS
jgi:predicted transcriptional regulator